MVLENILSSNNSISNHERYILNRNYRHPNKGAVVALDIIERLESTEHMDVLDIKSLTKIAYHAFQKDPTNFPHLEKLISFYNEGIEKAKRWETCPALRFSPDIALIRYSMSKMVSHMERYMGELIFEKYTRTLDRGLEDRMLLFQARDLITQAVDNPEENDPFYMGNSCLSRSHVIMRIAHINHGEKRIRLIQQEIEDIKMAIFYFQNSKDNKDALSICNHHLSKAEKEIIQIRGKLTKHVTGTRSNRRRS